MYIIVHGPPHTGYKKREYQSMVYDIRIWKGVQNTSDLNKINKKSYQKSVWAHLMKIF